MIVKGSILAQGYVSKMGSQISSMFLIYNEVRQM